MAESLHTFVAPKRKLQAWLSSTSRSEFFAGLLFLACANGLATRIISYVSGHGWADAIVGTFGISAIVWVACFAGLHFVLHEHGEPTKPEDLVVGAGVLALIALPDGALAWIGLSVLGLYILLFTNSSISQRRGVIILLAATIPMFWSRLVFQFFSSWILEVDATLVGWLLGTDRVGNMVRFADNQSFLVILPACSSFANMSLAFLCWVTLSQAVRHRWFPTDLVWCVFACTSVIVVNVTRLSLMGLSYDHYDAIHSEWGQLATEVITLILAMGFCVLGVRRELFVRA